MASRARAPRRRRVEAVDNGLVYVEGREEPLQLWLDGTVLRAVPIPTDDGLVDQDGPTPTFGDIMRQARTSIDQPIR